MLEDEGLRQDGDEAMARRLKALACTAPLHQLDSRKTRLDWLDGTDYQMAEIALQAIDQVTIAMDFDRGAAPDWVMRGWPPSRLDTARCSTPRCCVASSTPPVGTCVRWTGWPRFPI